MQKTEQQARHNDLLNIVKLFMLILAIFIASPSITLLKEYLNRPTFHKFSNPATEHYKNTLIKAIPNKQAAIKTCNQIKTAIGKDNQFLGLFYLRCLEGFTEYQIIYLKQ